MVDLSSQRKTLAQTVAEDLLSQIQAGAFAPGTKLPAQRQLMETYGVGANVVREACQMLVMAGVLDVRPGRGSTVVGVSSDRALGPDTVAALLENQAILDLAEFRQVIEVEIAEKAAARAEPEDIEAMQSALESFEAALEAHESVYDSDIEFHKAVAHASQNQVFVNALDALGDLLRVARERTAAVPGTTERAAEEHRRVFEAVLARNPAAARAAMAAHMTTVAETTRAMQIDTGERSDRRSQRPEQELDSGPS
ncbi:MAG: FadR/GntR family transcriptional regulator [Nocardioides sp.]|uniref:FadR/GntR family transcriptional regulator n=1 Tax=Nocardioides sp. TaxID=35761 RepID=UPI0039E240CC